MRALEFPRKWAEKVERLELSSEGCLEKVEMRKGQFLKITVGV